MTVEIDIFVLAILLFLLILTVFLVPFISQAKKTAREAETLLSDLRRELIPTLRDLGEVTERINRVSLNIENISDKTEHLFDSLEKMLDSVDHLTDLFRKDLLPLAENAACLILGVKTASKVLFKGNREKGD